MSTYPSFRIPDPKGPAGASFGELLARTRATARLRTTASAPSVDQADEDAALKELSHLVSRLSLGLVDTDLLAGHGGEAGQTVRAPSARRWKP